MPTPLPSEPWIEAGREAGLLQAAHRGERESFYELLREHFRALHALCFAFTLDEDAASRLTQDTARLAWRGIRQLPVGHSFFPFAARIARNLAVAHARRRDDLRRGRRYAPSTSPGGAALTPAERNLRDAFIDLTPDEQMLLTLRLVLGLDYVRIARILDVTVGSVMHRLQALRGTLEAAERREAA